MPDVSKSDVLDACERYISMATGVSVLSQEQPMGPWSSCASWKVAGYTRASEVCQAIGRVTIPEGRYRVVFRLRNGTDRHIIIVRGASRAHTH